MATSSGSAHLHGRGGGGCSLHGPTEASGPQMFSTLSCVAITSVAEQNGGGSAGSVDSGVGWLPPARSLQGPTEASGPQMFSTLAAWNPTDALAGVSVSVAGEARAAGGSAAAAAAAAAADDDDAADDADAEAVVGVVSARLEA
eukprot:scaffold76923_cov30-Phaeocystis_antarctica.AAC.1